MPKYIDARGKACPMPVILAKKEIDDGQKDITVTVDNETAVENLKRLAQSSGLAVKTEKKGDFYDVIFENGGENAVPETKEVKEFCIPCGGYTVFFGKDYVGEGDHTLGHNLAKMMLYTLSESDDIPESIIFMNSGVKIPTDEKLDAINSLNVLAKKGTNILVCGTCLNYYGLTEKLKVGTVSNMYEILEKMKSSAKVITV